MGVPEPEDAETVIDSDGSEGKDFTRGFAQRATDPYIKERKAKGQFVVRPRPVVRSRVHSVPFHEAQLGRGPWLYAGGATWPGQAGTAVVGARRGSQASEHVRACVL